MRQASSPLTLGTALLLLVPPLLWAGNAVVGRMVNDLAPPITLNFLRWVGAFVLLLPLAHSVLRTNSPVWVHWRRYALLGLLGVVPLLAHASWYAYRDLVAPSDETAHP